MLEKSWSKRNEIGSDWAQPLLRVKDSTPAFSSSSSELAATVTDCQTAQPTPACFISLIVAQSALYPEVCHFFLWPADLIPLLLRDWVSLSPALKVNPPLLNLFFPQIIKPQFAIKPRFYCICYFFKNTVVIFKFSHCASLIIFRIKTSFIGQKCLTLICAVYTYYLQWIF